MRERKPKFGAPGKVRPAVFALEFPKASAPRLHQRNVGGKNLLTGCLPKTQAAMRCGGSAPATPDEKEKPSPQRLPGEGSQPISSEPAPSHRPWECTSGATPA